MAGNSVVRARIDKRTKREAAAALKKIGLTVSDAFRLLLVRVATEKHCRSSRSIPTPKRSLR
jgi:DNA-damage-inducible protein J